MYLLFLTLLGSALGVPLTKELTKTTATATAAERYVLPGESMPTFYDVRLFIDPGNPNYFNGSVTIRVLPIRRTNELVLHAMELTIFDIVVQSERDEANIFESYDLATDDTHILRIRLSETIEPVTPYSIHIDYSGTYAENMFGIYVSTYTDSGRNVNLVTSQLQPTYARRAFPCYDEPALKAIFRTTIYAPPAYPVVRSNMPERSASDNLKPDVEGYVKYEFQDTLVMSTYLLAYLVSEFTKIDNEQDPIYRIPFHVYSRPGTQDTAHFALDFGQRNMLALENYTDFLYDFPKMDKVAVPDFAAGAMENWGLVIYREVALLVQEGVTTTAIKQNIARIICHENMHQWFGNEVSPLSWTFTWLNEGFANFFENYATDLVLPEYRMMDQYILILQGVMQNDAVLGVNPMTHPVFSPSEIIGTFNAVAYQKSGSVIRMTQHFLTPEIFRRGLIIYIRDNSRRAVAPASLYAAFQEALEEAGQTVPWPVSTILERWTTQGGFPVLTVRRSAPNAESVFVSQERFLTDQTLTATERWHVPVNWVLSTSPDFSETKPQSWIPPWYPAEPIDIPGLSSAEWFIFNKQQTGYYRVNYDESNWAALAKVLNSEHETIHVLNRAQIVDDSFNLARNGRLTYTYPFEISHYLVNEKDYIPWGSAQLALNYLDIVLSGSEVYELFQNYMLHITAPLFEELGFNTLSSDEHVTAFHRNIILDANCRHGNPQCVSTAQQMLQDFRNNPQNRPHPDIQVIVYCSGLRGGDPDNFDFIWDQYLQSTDASEQSIYLNALGCTSNEEKLNFYLNQVIDDNTAVREQDRHTIIVAVTNASPANMDKAFDFVIEEFDKIQTRVQGLSGTNNILNGLARRLNTEEHGRKLDEFIARHQGILTAAEQAAVGAIRENIDSSITWVRAHYPTVEAWLNENHSRGAASALSASLLVLFSIVLAIFSN